MKFRDFNAEPTEDRENASVGAGAWYGTSSAGDDQAAAAKAAAVFCFDKVAAAAAFCFCGIGSSWMLRAGFISGSGSIGNGRRQKKGADIVRAAAGFDFKTGAGCRGKKCLMHFCGAHAAWEDLSVGTLFRFDPELC